MFDRKSNGGRIEPTAYLGRKNFIVGFSRGVLHRPVGQTFMDKFLKNQMSYIPKRYIFLFANMVFVKFLQLKFIKIKF